MTDPISADELQRIRNTLYKHAKEAETSSRQVSLVEDMLLFSAVSLIDSMRSRLDAAERRVAELEREVVRLKHVAWDRADPMCPYCDSGVTAKDCDYDSGTATCPECGESFTLEQASGSEPC